MKGKKHSAEEIFKKLREVDAMIALGKTIGQVCICAYTRMHLPATLRYNMRMVRRVLRTIGITCCFAFLGASEVVGVQRVVSTTAQFSAALAAAATGDQIILQPGVYGGGHYRANLQQVTIRGADPANPAIIDGGSNGIQLSDSSNVTISDLVFRNQVGNGLNIDDGGTVDTPAVNLILRNITVRDIVTAGNHDGIKLSGVNDFLIENVQVLNWGTGEGAAGSMSGDAARKQARSSNHIVVKHAAIDIHPRERRRAAYDHVSFGNYLVRFMSPVR